MKRLGLIHLKKQACCLLAISCDYREGSVLIETKVNSVPQLIRLELLSHLS